MRNLVIALCALMICGVAYATDKKPPEPPADPKAVASADATASSIAKAESAAVASSSSGGNVQSMEIRDRLQAPASFSPSIAPTAPCYYSASAGLSIPGGSIGGGKAILDPACQLREEIRLGAQIGLLAEAQAKWCAEYGKDIEGCGRLTPPAQEPEAKPLVVVLQGDGCGQRYDDKLKRVLEKCVSK